MWETIFDHFARASVSTGNGEVVLRTTTGSLLLWAMVPTAALVAAIVCWRLSRRAMAPGQPHRDSAVKVRIVTIGLMLFSVVLYGLLLPAVALAEVRITNDRLTQTVGFWWEPNVREFRFDEIESIRAGRAAGEFGDRVLLIISHTDDTVEEFNPGDLFEANWPLIADELRQRGVNVMPRGD